MRVGTIFTSVKVFLSDHKGRQVVTWRPFPWMVRMEILVNVLVLAALEIVLGVDNIVLLSMLTGKLPAAQRPLARRLGLGFALVTRMGLLSTLSWIMSLTQPLLFGATGRDLILVVGGAFLVFKAIRELFFSADPSDPASLSKGKPRLWGTLLEIAFLDIVFSLDSVITAVGMSNHLGVMITAMVLASLVMVLSADFVGDFILANPNTKNLALAFLVLVGGVLVADGFHQHFDHTPMYVALAFSVAVELLNRRTAKKG